MLCGECDSFLFCLPCWILQLYCFTYSALYKKLEADLQMWMLYDLSRIAKVYSIKMTLLYRLLYYFRSLPITLNRMDVLNLQSIIIWYVWGFSTPYVSMLSKMVLFTPRSKSGYGLPNLMLYYQDAQFAQLSVIYSHSEKLDWVLMERLALRPCILQYLKWKQAKQQPPILVLTLSNSFAVWDRLQNNANLIPPFHALAHLFNNPEFPLVWI